LIAYFIVNFCQKISKSVPTTQSYSKLATQRIGRFLRHGVYCSQTAGWNIESLAVMQQKLTYTDLKFTCYTPCLKGTTDLSREWRDPIMLGMDVLA